jgi:hypothetical protein
MTGFTEAATRERTTIVHARHRGAADQIFQKEAIALLDDLRLKTPENVNHFVYQGAFERTEHYIGDGFAWAPDLRQLIDVDGELAAVTAQGGVVPAYRAGHTYVEAWNRAPFGPAFSEIIGEPQAARDGDILTIAPTLFSEVSVPSRAGQARGEARQALFRDGELIQEQIDEGGRFDSVEVPAARATYRFEADATRLAAISDLSSRVTATWTFTSEHTDRRQVLALPTLRFAPTLDDDNRAPRQLPLILPVTIERLAGAPTPRLVAVTVEASFDDGTTWSTVPGALSGTHFRGIVVNPPGAQFVSLRGSASDTAGNRVEQTILRAYKLK